jgi:hypothetical protein
MMDFDFSALMNYGALGICLAYFIYKDNSTMKDLRNTVQELKEAILILKEKNNN